MSSLYKMLADYYLDNIEFSSSYMINIHTLITRPFGAEKTLKGSLLRCTSTDTAFPAGRMSEFRALILSLAMY